MGFTVRTIGAAWSLAVLGCWPAPLPGVDLEETSDSSAGELASCFDLERNLDETDVDCGGEVCTGCIANAACQVDQDCATGSCATGRCVYLPSCRALLAAGVATSGVYWVDFDGDGPATPAKVLCDQDSDGGGWTLAIKVNTADRLDVSERREQFRDGFNPHLLLDTAMELNRGIATHGLSVLRSAVSENSWARIMLLAGADPTQTATWFKTIASPGSLARWFDDDDEASLACSTLDLDGQCRLGVFARRDNATYFGGLTLSDRGFDAVDELHLRLVSGTESTLDDYFPESGVCSATYDSDNNAWRDTAGGGGHWGNGLLIWIR